MTTTTATAQETVSLLVSPRVIRPQPRPIRVSPRFNQVASASPQPPPYPPADPLLLSNRSKRRKGKLKSDDAQRNSAPSRPRPLSPQQEDSSSVFPKRSSPDSDPGGDNDQSASSKVSSNDQKPNRATQAVTLSASDSRLPQSTTNQDTSRPKPLLSISPYEDPCSKFKDYQRSQFSFPRSPLLAHPSFDFPSPAASRHQPPPHPGPVLRSLAHHSIRSPPRPDHRLLQHAASCPSYFSQPYGGPRGLNRVLCPQHHTIKRPLSLTSPTSEYTRTKKRKVFHLSFRSSLIMYPVDYWMRPRVPPIPSSSNCLSPDCTPKWLTTPASSEGQVSSLCPSEERWTGTGKGWQNIQPKICFSGPHSLLPTHRATSPLGGTSPTSRQAPCSWPPPNLTSQGAPLKAQLLAILRLRSNTGPGEASLRFKKWVIWNAWIRRENSTVPSYTSTVGTPSSSLSSAIGEVHGERSNSAWTGDEVFDENGDLVCSDDEAEQLDDEEFDSGLDEDWISNREEERKRNNLQTEGKETKIRIRLSSISTQFPHPTPPASPTSAEPQAITKWDENSEQGCCNQSDAPKVLLPLVNHAQRPPTPPPSPPNGK